MVLPSFECSVPGKIVLAGEHAVLRGAHAFVLPHPQFRLRLRAFVNPDAVPDGALKDFIDQTRADFFQRIQKPIPRWAHELEIRVDSTIPQGAGAGSSAALCVSFLKLWNRYDQLPLDEHHALATKWENTFHGQSSGMDIAAVLWGRPLLFRKGHDPVFHAGDHAFALTVHDTQLRSKTKDAIHAVSEWRSRNTLEADAVDAEMDAAAKLAFRASEDGNVALLADAIRRAQSCFEKWGLMPAEAQSLRLDLERQGALAVKMTGSGLGGFLVALWSDRSHSQNA